MDIGVLGPLVVESDSVRMGPRDRVVLAALVARRGEAVSAEQLADALWGDELPASWAKVVQGCVTRLRKTLGREAIETVGHGYRLSLLSDMLDVARFESAAGKVAELLTLGEPDRAAFTAEQALGLWRGRPFVDLEGWEPAEIESARLEELRRDLDELRLDALLRAGRYREVLPRARALVSEGLLRERPWVLLARAQYQAGRQGEALETLRRARTVLSQALGLDPGPELAELEAAILRQDPELVPEPSGDVSPVCPYMGLVPYDVGNADGFFGRDTEVAACLERLANTGMVAVVGPSGSGKSSLVRAGVTATVQRDGRQVVVITPGPRPMDALTVMPDRGATPLLVVDQLEEALTLCDDENERSRFFDALVEHAERSGLVVALRADRLGDLAAYPSFAHRAEQSLYLLKAMDEEELRAAIEGPARQAGLLLEAGLVDLLILDVEGEPGALPLLSHALRETWLAREGRTLTVAGYQAAGGIRGAVSQTAEHLYAAADERQRALLRDLLLRLVAPSPEGDPVRARVPRRMVATDTDHEHIIDLLVGARLLTSDDGVIELAHESLARAWPRLRGWLDDDIEGQRILRHLATTADAWETMGRPDSELYRGARLTKALEWRDRSSPDLTPTEDAFLDASQARNEADRLAARRRRRTLVTVLIGATVVASLFGTIALLQARQANMERDRAEAEAARAEQAAGIARSRELVASAIAALDIDPALAKLLALEAVELEETPTVDSLSLLHRVYAADHIIGRYAWATDDDALFMMVDLHRDGERMLAAGSFEGPSDRMEMYDFLSQETIWSWETRHPQVGVAQSRFTPEGRQVVSGVMWLPTEEADTPHPADLVGVQVRDAATGELQQVFDVGPCGGWVTGVSDRHIAVLTFTTDEPDCDFTQVPLTALLIDRGTGQEQVLSTDAYAVLALSADGSVAAFTEDPGGVEPLLIVAVDVVTGERLAAINPDEHGLGPADGGYWYVQDVNHDGTRVLTGSRRLVVWDVTTQELITTIGVRGGALFPRFSPDGSSIYGAAHDGILWQWDARWGDVQAKLAAAGSGRIAASADGRLLVSDVATRGAALLDPAANSEVWALPVCDGPAAQSLGAAGGHAVLSEFCGDAPFLTTYVIDLTERSLVNEVYGHYGQHIAISPDGTRFIRQEGEERDGRQWLSPPRIRDLLTGELQVEVEGICSWDLGGDQFAQEGCAQYPEPPSMLWNFRFAWSSDSSRVAVIRQGWPGGSGVQIWDADSGALLHTADGCWATGALFTASSEELIVACAGGLTALSTDNWTEVRSSDLGPMVKNWEDFELAGYTADGMIVGVGSDGTTSVATVILWFDPETLQRVHFIERAHNGLPKSHALNADATMLAIGSADGFVKVWDVVERQLVHEIYVGDVQVQGVAFVGDHHLAVAPESGGLVLYTLDPRELIDLVRGSVTRGFTETECARYNFGDDCPDLLAER